MDYIDITSQEYTDKIKKYYLMISIIKFVLNLIVTLGLVCLAYILAPYIKGDMELDPIPLTLSQLESLFMLLFVYWMFRHTLKGGRP